MDAKDIVRRLIENDEDPKDFIGRNPDIYPKGEATHRYGFNLGEGNYSVGIAFGINASSKQEAVHRANGFIRQFFFGKSLGSHDLPITELEVEGVGHVAVEDFRVYIDDDFEVTEEMIVTVDPLEPTPEGWNEIEGGEPQ